MKRKGRTARDCLKEARSELAGRRTGNGYKATPTETSGLMTASLKWPRVRRRRSGGVRRRSMSLPGEISLAPERATVQGHRHEKSAEAVVTEQKPAGRTPKAGRFSEAKG